MQFVHVISGVEDLEIWSASTSGFSFVISYQRFRPSGARAGFVASWRPIYQNRCAAVLGYLTR